MHTPTHEQIIDVIEDAFEHQAEIRPGQVHADLHAALGDRDVLIAREITKRFETITRMPLARAQAWVDADEDRRRGELVLVIEGRAPARDEGADPRAVLAALMAEVPLKQAVALAAKITGAKRNALYAMALEMKG